MFNPSVCFANERANASFYIDTFGRVSREHNPLADRAHRVFERLKQVAGNTTSGAELILIDTDSKPWAIALADGNVILSKGALDVIYASGDLVQADAWLAFVLGHEIAHLGSKDLWQQHAFASLSALPDLEDSDLTDVQQAMTLSAFDTAAWRERELKADELGYIIGALAGFEVQQVFGDRKRRQDFLTVWEEATGSSGQTHYSAKVRTEFLRVRLNASDQRLDQFQLGLMLAYAGRLDDALTVFLDFQRFYPSRAVLTNLGYVHLQLARKAMPVHLAYRYWLPTFLLPDSGLRIPTRTFATGMSDQAVKHLEDASQYLRQAYRMDPRDLAVSTNLVATYLYLGKYFRARSVVEESLEYHQNAEDLKILKALVLVDQEPDIDMWPRAVENLQALDTDDDTSAIVLFNLARLHHERGRHGKAREYWTRLYRNSIPLPPSYHYQVCSGLDIECNINSSGNGTFINDLSVSGSYPLFPGDSLQDDHVRRLVSSEYLNHWRIQEITGSTIKSNTMTAFLFEDVVELVRYKFPPLHAVNNLLAETTPVNASWLGSQRVLQIDNGLSLIESEGQVVEAWVTR